MTDLVTRAAWGARAPRNRSTSITNEGLTLHYGGSPVWGGNIGDHGRCATIWRGWQNYHMDSNGWADIAYSWGVCPHGVLFEGRGKGIRTAANGTNDGNNRSHAICYIGGTGDPFTDQAKVACLDAEGMFGLVIKWKHNNWLSTGCPGGPCAQWFDSGKPRPGSAPAPAPSPPPAPSGHSHGIPLVKFATGGPDSARVHGAVRRPDGSWVWQTNYSQVFWEVADIQQHMRNQRHAIAVDGVGGPDTLRQLKEYQNARGLTADGVVGPNTWGKLHSG